MRVPVALAAMALALGMGAPAVAQTTAASPEQIDAALGAVPPRAALMYDPAAKRSLGALRPDRRLPPASLLKMITALIVAEQVKPDEHIVITPRASTAPHDRLKWRRGAMFTADQVMHGLLMESSNGAAYALAAHVGGSIKGFARLADAWLARRGLTDTRLIDPSGLDAPGQYASAGDLAIVAHALLRNPWLADIVRTRSYELPWPDGGSATFGNINRFMWDDPTAVGVKSGFTSAAGNTVVAAATRSGRTHIVVVLNSTEAFPVAKRLMDLAFTLAPPRAGDIRRAEVAAASRSSLAIKPITTVDPVEEEGEEEGETVEFSAPLAVTPASSARPPVVLLGIFTLLAFYVYRQRWQQLKRAAPAVPRRVMAPPVPEPVEQIYEEYAADVEPPWSPFKRAARTTVRPVDAQEWQYVRARR